MTIMAQRVDIKENWTRSRKDTGRESIHSGHFMISDFEAEAQDDEDELAVPVPEVAEPKAVIPCYKPLSKVKINVKSTCNQLSIETSLTKLFQCMSIAYRQKLTSPKWNRFKGVRLRWKDKIRLNNVIWRCWHMQFINKQSTLVCQFASPLDVDTHNKPEAIVLEGKYWKRKLHAVTAEYKKWRMFTHNQILGKPEKHGHDLLAEFEQADWQTQTSDSAMMVDEDYMSLMSDTLFSAITGNVPFHFPDTREIARGANLADFIQPSLVQLQPSLDEFMDIEPLQDFLSAKLPSVAEEIASSLSQSTNYSKSIASVQPNTSQQQQQAVLNQNYQQDGSYPVWYIPPSSFNQQSIYQQPPPPPPPPPSHIQPIMRKDELHSVAKSKLKHRSRSSPGMNKKLAGSGTSPPSPLQSDLSSASIQHLSTNPSTSSPPQSSALLEQLLSSSTSNLYHFLEQESNSVTKMPQAQQLSQAQCVEVPYLSTSYEQVENNQILFQRQASEIISKPQKSHFVQTEKSSGQLSPPSSETSSPTKCAVLSPIPTVPSVVNPANSCPESPGSCSQDPLSLSPLNVGSPSSPKSIPGYKEHHRRVCHINAEQKRRCNIKNGFDTLHALIPQINQNPNAKMSKAAMLQKGADYIVQLRNERISLKQEMENLKQQIDSLNSTICNCQSMLPVTGAPVSRHRSNKMKDMFRQYVRTRTNENWKFWILSLIFEPLLESFNNNVSTNSIEDLYQTTLQWVDQHCSLVDLRPVVLNALRHLCTTTEVLSDPGRLPSEARAAVEKSTKKSSREGANSK